MREIRAKWIKTMLLAIAAGVGAYLVAIVIVGSVVVWALHLGYFFQDPRTERAVIQAASGLMGLLTGIIVMKRSR